MDSAEGEPNGMMLGDWESVDLWAPADDMPPLQPTVLRRLDGVPLLYPGRVNVVVGPPEAGKSWFCAMAIAEQVRALQDVVLVDLEDSRPLWQQRLQALGVVGGTGSGAVRYLQPSGSWQGGRLPPALASLADDATLVVIDSTNALMDLLGLDPNSVGDVETLYRRFIVPLAALGPAILVTDHPTKDREQSGIPGHSERKLSRVDGAVLAIERGTAFRPGATGRAKLTIVKDRLGAVRRHQEARNVVAVMELASSDDGSEVRAAVLPPATPSAAEESEGNTSEVERRVLEALGADPGLSTGDLPKAARGRREVVMGVVGKLVDEGRVVVRREGKTKCHFLARDLPQLAPGKLGDGQRDLAPLPHPLRGGKGAGTDRSRRRQEDGWSMDGQADPPSACQAVDDDRQPQHEGGESVSSSTPEPSGREPSSDDGVADLDASQLLLSPDPDDAPPPSDADVARWAAEELAVEAS